MGDDQATFWWQTWVWLAFFFPVCCIAMATDSSPGLAETSGLPIPLNCGPKLSLENSSAGK